jgi:hypothetical protein
MTDRTLYYREYMRAYRKRQREALGIATNPKLGRPRLTERVERPAPPIMAKPGWPTREQLMGRR